MKFVLLNKSVIEKVISILKKINKIVFINFDFFFKILEEII